MVHLLGMAVSYYNRVSNKWHVKALTFKALMQSVNHLTLCLFKWAFFQEHLEGACALTFHQKFFLSLFYLVENLSYNGNVEGQKWPILSNNEAFLTIMFSILCSKFWAWLLAISSFPHCPLRCVLLSKYSIKFGYLFTLKTYIRLRRFHP